MTREEEESAPATHDVRVAAEDLAEAADDDIREGEHLDVDEVADRLVHYDKEVILVCKLPQTCEVR